MENKPASLLVVSLGKALNGTSLPLCRRQVAQISLQKEGWWQEGHPTIKQMPCYKNADYLLWRPLIGKSRKKKKKTKQKNKFINKVLIVVLFYNHNEVSFFKVGG